MIYFALDKREQFAVSLRRKKKIELIALKRGRPGAAAAPPRDNPKNRSKKKNLLSVIGQLSKAKYVAEVDSKQKWRIRDGSVTLAGLAISLPFSASKLERSCRSATNSTSLWRNKFKSCEKSQRLYKMLIILSKKQLCLSNFTAKLFWTTLDMYSVTSTILLTVRLLICSKLRHSFAAVSDFSNTKLFCQSLFKSTSLTTRLL